MRECEYTTNDKRHRVTVEAEPFGEEQKPATGAEVRTAIEHGFSASTIAANSNWPVEAVAALREAMDHPPAYFSCPPKGSFYLGGETKRWLQFDGSEWKPCGPPAPTLEEALRVVREVAIASNTAAFVFGTGNIGLSGEWANDVTLTPAQAAEKLHELAEERKPKMTPAQAWAAMRPLLGDEAGSKYLALLSPETLDVLDEHFAGTCA